MPRAISTQNIFKAAAIGLAAIAGVQGVRSASATLTDYFIQRDNQLLGEVIGFHNIQDNHVSVIYADQIAQRVLPRITPEHTKMRGTLSHIFFVKPPDANEDISVILTSAVSNPEGTYFNVREGLKVTPYLCHYHQQIYINANVTLPRHKAHIADISSKCSDVTSERHIEINRDKIAFSHRIPHSLRDELVMAMSEQTIDMQAPSLNIKGQSYVIRPNPTPHVTDKQRPFAFINGTMHSCDLTLSVNNVAGYPNRSDRNIHPIIAVYECGKINTASLR
jgi:hypothetical protein